MRTDWPAGTPESRLKDFINWAEVHLSTEDQGRAAALLLGLSQFGDIALFGFCTESYKLEESKDGKYTFTLHYRGSIPEVASVDTAATETTPPAKPSKGKRKGAKHAGTKTKPAGT